MTQKIILLKTRFLLRTTLQLNLLFIFLLSSQLVLPQYKVDSSIKKDYFKIHENLKQEFKDEIIKEFKEGLSLVYQVKTDTLNKQDKIKDFNSIKLEPINSETGQIDTTETTLTDEERISKNDPYPLNCSCSFKKDTLIISSSIYLFSGFAVTAKVYKNNVRVTYSEVESEVKSLKRTLKEAKRFEITIPAKVNFLTMDRIPTRNMPELFGHIGILTSGYYSYINAFEFETDYIHKRMNLQFYFRCDMKSGLHK